MQRRRLLVALGASATAASLTVRAQPAVVAPAASAPPPTGRPPPRPMGELKSLGPERYQIGGLVVDKRARSFSVPGRVLVLDKPLEYLATGPDGRKAYESLLELDAIGSEFNLACILIGLERDRDLPLSQPPTANKVVGQRVLLTLAWMEAGQRRQISAAEALFSADAKAKAATVEWVYTGSYMSPDGSQFAADQTGTLIAFIPDPNAVIGIASGADIGPYGSVRGSSLLPPEGSAIQFVVRAATAAK